MKSAVVIGGGIAGLAAAALLAKQGMSVTLLEKNATVGGRAQFFRAKGFTFDMGPSWYLMPEVFDRYFNLFGKKTRDYYALERLDPHYKVFFNGEHAVVSKSLKKNLELFEKWEPGSAGRVRDYLKQSERAYRIAMDNFIYKSYDSILDIASPKLAWDALRLGLFESYHAHVQRFVNDARIQRILEYTNVFLGGSPENTPAIYSIMAHVDFTLGVHYPQGGMLRIPEALLSLCKEMGVRVQCNEEAERIIIEHGNAKAVRTKKRTYAADVVVSGADYPHTEMKLLPKESRTYPQEYWEKTTLAPSALCIYLGVKGRVRNLEHHNLYYSSEWDAHFASIFQKKEWPRKPSYYVCCPSKTDASVAPKGCENLFILVPVASGLSDTDAKRKALADETIAHLCTLIGEDFRKRIVFKRVFSQRDYAQAYNAYKGTALGLAHTLSQTAFLRPANRSARVRNLYYAGQYTLPGVGVPMTLISAQLAAERVAREQA